jgi:hypothetical protein
MPTLRLRPDLEEGIRAIPGVRAASVVTGPDAVPIEVHVAAAPGKPAKQIVRDIQSLALARYDIELDHRIVSVVQLDDEETAPMAAPTARRPVIAGVTVRTSGDTTTVDVQIGSGDELFDGSASGPKGPTHRPRLVAHATLDALDELLGHPCEVENATVVKLGPREVALSVLTLTLPRVGEQVMTGTAPVRGDQADAVARSVLNALNRQLSG